MPKYLLEVTPETYDLCVFLNDGVDIASPNTTYLAVEINSPREITTKVLNDFEVLESEYDGVPRLKFKL